MHSFPAMPLAEWQPTRDTIHRYTRALGVIRRSLTPPQKHAGQHSVFVAGAGLTTTPIRGGEQTFELVLDFSAHQLAVITSHGDRRLLRLRGQPAATLFADTLAALGGMGIEVNIDAPAFVTTAPGAYDVEAVERFWQALSQIDWVFKRFKAGLREETGPVQLWPHHFDLAVLWFSGRLIPGADPANAEYADEQMNFGFSTGDGGIHDPYFYITAYPLPPELPSAALPEGATWHSEGWQGALLRYDAIAERGDAAERVLDFLQTLQKAGARLVGRG